jgi:hypothetical protein
MASPRIMLPRYAGLLLQPSAALLAPLFILGGCTRRAGECRWITSGQAIFISGQQIEMSGLLTCISLGCIATDVALASTRKQPLSGMSSRFLSPPRLRFAQSWRRLVSMLHHIMDQPPNYARAHVKTPDTKIGDDQIFDMGNFVKTICRIRWSKNEVSYSLALQRTRPSHSGCNAHVPWAGSLSLGRPLRVA